MITSLEWHFPLLKNKVTSKECIARPPLSCRKVICTEFIHIILHRVGSSVFSLACSWCWRLMRLLWRPGLNWKSQQSFCEMKCHFKQWISPRWGETFSCCCEGKNPTRSSCCHYPLLPSQHFRLFVRSLLSSHSHMSDNITHTAKYAKTHFRHNPDHVTKLPAQMRSWTNPPSHPYILKCKDCAQDQWNSSKWL